MLRRFQTRRASAEAGSLPKRQRGTYRRVATECAFYNSSRETTATLVSIGSLLSSYRLWFAMPEHGKCRYLRTLRESRGAKLRDGFSIFPVDAFTVRHGESSTAKILCRSAKSYTSAPPFNWGISLTLCRRVCELSRTGGAVCRTAAGSEFQHFLRLHLHSRMQTNAGSYRLNVF